MKNMKTYYSAILAGIFISLGCIIYTTIGGPLGAFLFAFGLIAVLSYKTSLFTGMIGYAKINTSDIIQILLTILGNLSGAALMVLFAKLAGLSLNQPNISPVYIFPRSIMCGMMMYIMVEGIKNSQSNVRVLLLLGVPLFILSGMSHSVANMFYILYFNYNNIIKEFLIIIISLVGNTIGAKIIRGLQKLAKE